MADSAWSHYNKLTVVGVNFKKADVAHRNKFAITLEQSKAAYQSSEDSCLQNFFILSTCNRTEIYGLVPCHYILLHFLKAYSLGTMEEINQYCYVKEGDEAIEHFLTVASGLDSQIPGDYEIISQIKSAFQVSKENGRGNGYLERLVNQALQVSKAVKNTTSFSDGTLSVSYAVMQEIKNLKLKQPIICVAGLGEIGLLTLKNIKAYLPEANIVLVNRSEEKLNEVAAANGAEAFSLTSIDKALAKSEIVIMCTGAAQPILNQQLLEGSAVRYIYDLSVPQNVAAEVYTNPNYTVKDIDRISQDIANTVSSRMAEIPKVKEIVKQKAHEFVEWSGKRDYVSLATRVQKKLELNPVADKVISHAYHSYASKYVAEPTNRRKILEAVCIDAFRDKTVEVTVREAIASIQHEDYASHFKNNNERKPSCFMANQCCHSEVGAKGLFVHHPSN